MSRKGGDGVNGSRGKSKAEIVWTRETVHPALFGERGGGEGVTEIKMKSEGGGVTQRPPVLVKKQTKTCVELINDIKTVL